MIAFWCSLFIGYQMFGNQATFLNSARRHCSTTTAGACCCFSQSVQLFREYRRYLPRVGDLLHRRHLRLGRSLLAQDGALSKRKRQCSPQWQWERKWQRNGGSNGNGGKSAGKLLVRAPNGLYLSRQVLIYREFMAFISFAVIFLALVCAHLSWRTEPG